MSTPTPRPIRESIGSTFGLVTSLGTGVVGGSPEPDDTLEEAPDVTGALAVAGAIRRAGEIAETAVGEPADVDLISFTLEQGEAVTIRAEASEGGDLDTVLRLFGPDGREVAVDDDGLSGLDSLIAYLAATPGRHTVGVSGFDNFGYDPAEPTVPVGSTSFGPYRLTIEQVDPPSADPALAEPNDTIATASDITTALAEGDDRIRLDGVIGDDTAAPRPADDVDILTVELEAGDAVAVRPRFREFANLEPSMRFFEETGRELPQVFLDGGTGFVAPTDGIYAIGLSGDLAEYDPTVAGSAESGERTGFYRVRITKLEDFLDLTEPNDVRAEALDVTARLTSEIFLALNGFVGDGPSGEDDVDLIAIDLEERQGLSAFVFGDFAAPTVLRVFDPQGREIPLEFGGSGGFAALDAGTYTVGVSAFGNDAYDPDVAGSGSGGRAEGLYTLELSTSAPADPVRGTPDADDLGGGRSSDDIAGLGGDDFLRGRRGDDLLDGGAGDDLVRGGEGNDRIAGGSGDDVLQGKRGADTIDGGPGDDVIDGGALDDVLTGGEGADTFVVLLGDDVVTDFAIDDGDTLVIDPGLVLSGEADFVALAQADRAEVTLSAEADEAGVVRRLILEPAVFGASAELNLVGDGLTLDELAPA